MDDLDDTALAVAEPLEKTFERRNFITRFRKMRYCTDRCPVYDICPVMPIAQAKKDTVKKECAMRSMPEKIKKRFERLFLQGQDGLVNELLTSVYTVGMKTDLEGDISDHRAYSHLLMATTKVLYGDKIGLEGDQQSTITVNVINLEDTMNKKQLKSATEVEVKVIDVESNIKEKSDDEVIAEYEREWKS